MGDDDEKAVREEGRRTGKAEERERARKGRIKRRKRQGRKVGRGDP